MIKFTDKDNKTIAILTDEAEEPILLLVDTEEDGEIEDKKKPKKGPKC